MRQLCWLDVLVTMDALIQSGLLLHEVYCAGHLFVLGLPALCRLRVRMLVNHPSDAPVESQVPPSPRSMTSLPRVNGTSKVSYMIKPGSPPEAHIRIQHHEWYVTRPQNTKSRLAVFVAHVKTQKKKDGDKETSAPDDLGPGMTSAEPRQSLVNARVRSLHRNQGVGHSPKPRAPFARANLSS